MSQQNTFIRLPEVLRRTALTRTTLYELMQRKEFPAQVVLSPRRVGWVEHEVDAWSAARAEKQRGACAAYRPDLIKDTVKAALAAPVVPPALIAAARALIAQVDGTEPQS